MVRKKPFILIGLANVVIGFMPTYEHIDIFITYCIDCGGDAARLECWWVIYCGSVVFINEHIGVDKRYLGAGITFYWSLCWHNFSLSSGCGINSSFE